MPGETAFYQFGPFRLEPGERRLVGVDGPVPLAPKAFDLLVILVANAGRLLRKEELMERLWPGTFVEEVNLAQNVSAIRRALGDTRKTGFIETVPGAGYRFVAAIREIAATAPSAEGGLAQPRPPRLIVLPFRVLTPHPDIDFLSFSLADALSASLSALETVIVRSGLTAAKYAGGEIDLGRLARDADVNLVVSGTLAQSREELRVTAQLTDAEAGTLLWSETEKGSVSELFALQDTLVSRIVGSLALPLTTRERRQLHHDVPASARAYEFYLRANQLSVDANSWPVARDLYLQALEEDARYAPAWARLGRVYRLIGKYRPEARDASLARAEEALNRALSLNPDLPLAHSLYAQVDSDRGNAEAAMVRLLERAARPGASPDIYAGLVHACRYCGLIEASIAADARAHHLDATLETSVMHTYFVAQRHHESVESHHALKGYVYVISLFALGRGDEALQLAATLTREGNRVSGMVAAAAALIEGRRDESLMLLDEVAQMLIDPEGFYYAARQYAYLDAPDRALELLSRAVGGGYFCHAAMEADPWLASVRGDARFTAPIARAREGHAHARAAFEAADGARVLGPAPRE